MQVGANKEETVVNCAFQWAQRPDFVYLNVKYSSRIDGPVTVLNVDNEVVTFTNESFSFEGIGRQKPKKMQLKLSFHKEIDPNRSTWSFGSVGRLSITLAKVETQTPNPDPNPNPNPNPDPDPDPDPDPNPRPR